MKKILSLLAAVLTAGSMMADVMSVNFSQQGYTDQQEVTGYQNDPIFISLRPNSPGKASKYYNNGQLMIERNGVKYNAMDQIID